MNNRNSDISFTLNMEQRRKNKIKPVFVEGNKELSNKHANRAQEGSVESLLIVLNTFIPNCVFQMVKLMMKHV